MKSYKITVNGVQYDVTVEESTSSASAAPVKPQSAPAPAVAPVYEKGSIKVEAPMPGNILDIKVQTGSPVKTGDTLMILEAMKMENGIVAPSDGTVASIEVRKGDTVEAGQLLVTIK